VSEWVRLLVEAELDRQRQARNRVAAVRVERERMKAEIRGEGVR
jgi:hypothetical protein